MSPITPDDADRAGKKPRKGGKLPYPPSRDEPLSEVRQWLSDAAGLPPEVRIETVIRSGTEPDDPLTIVLSNKIEMRCPHQSRLQMAKSLQAFLASASDGLAMPAYLSPAEVGDFYTALCRMSAATARADPVSDLHEYLATYLALCEPVAGSLDDSRYQTLALLRARPVFDRGAAENRTPAKPAVLLTNGHRHIRASEWVAWLRAQGQIGDGTGLPARMAELGSVRIDPQAWNGDRSHKVHLVFYSVPEDL